MSVLRRRQSIESLGGLRLLFVANDAKYFLAHWLSRVRAAHAAGYEVHVAVPEGPGVGLLRQEHFSIHAIPLRRWSMNPAHELRTLFALTRLYRLLHPDLVHHLTIKPVLYGGIAAQLAGVRAVIAAMPGLGYVFTDRGFVRSLLRWGVVIGYHLAMRHRNMRVTFENSDDRALFIKYGLATRENSLLIRGAGVDMSEYRYTPESAGPPLAILASRLLWDKGIREFVVAAEALKQAKVAARFAIVGQTEEGSPAAVPRRQLEDWQASQIIEWWGWRDDMLEVLAQAHIVCLPSYYREGVPRVLIEAAACGRPIVTTNSPGCREIVRDDINGLLVPPRDTDALANALRRLIEDPLLRKRMGVRGREIAEADFSNEKVVNETLAVYRELLA